jgi:hypothetical protein
MKSRFILTLSEVERGRTPAFRLCRCLFFLVVACSFRLLSVLFGSHPAGICFCSCPPTTSHEPSDVPSIAHLCDGWDVKLLPASSCLRLSYPFPASGLLFSCGFTVLRTTINLFSVSNQNGAPNEIASAVISHPASSVTALKTASFGATRK